MEEKLPAPGIHPSWPRWGEAAGGQAGWQAAATEPAGGVAPAGATPGNTALTGGHSEPGVGAQHEALGGLIPLCCHHARMQAALWGFLCNSPQSQLATGLASPRESRRKLFAPVQGVSTLQPAAETT